MKLIIKIVFMSILCFPFLTLGNEDIKDILNKVKENYSLNKTYSLKTEYILFKGHSTETLTSKETGVTENSKAGFYQKIKNTERFINKDYMFQVSHDEKIILLGSPAVSSVNTNIEDALATISYKSLKEKDNHFIITFNFFGFTDVEFSRVIMKIDKTTFLLKTIDFYYSTFRDFSKQFLSINYDQPHLRMVFSEYKNASSKIESDFDTQNFIIEENGFTTLNEAWSDYELFDVRKYKN